MWSILYNILGGGVSYVGKKWGRGVVCGEKMGKGWGKTLNGTIGTGDSHGGKDLGGGGEGAIPTLQVSMSFFESDILTKN